MGNSAGSPSVSIGRRVMIMTDPIARTCPLQTTHVFSTAFPLPCPALLEGNFSPTYEIGVLRTLSSTFHALDPFLNGHLDGGSICRPYFPFWARRFRP